MWLLEEIIDSFPNGLPLGNYLSQYLANFYLSGFCHWLKEIIKVKHLFIYMDDVVILSENKNYLKNLFGRIKDYLKDVLKLEIKNNYQIFPISTRGIDFVGYVHYRTHTRLRKSIKKRFISMIKNTKNIKSINSYNGWIKHCDGKNLWNKYVNNLENKIETP